MHYCCEFRFSAIFFLKTEEQNNKNNISIREIIMNVNYNLFEIFRKNKSKSTNEQTKTENVIMFFIIEFVLEK